MIILIEGPDGSGKTTLAQELSLYLPVRRFKMPIESCDVNNYIQGCAYDRSWISEVVYRTFDRRVSELDIEDFERLFSNFIVIYCKSDTAFDDSMRRGEDNITNAEDAKRIKGLYDAYLYQLATFHGVRVIEYDWHKNDFKQLLEYLNL